MRIAIAGVPFSDNLGDFAIYRCLSSAIEGLRPSASCFPLDISGRTAFPDRNRAANKERLLNILIRMPQTLRPAVVRTRLRYERRKRLDGFRRLLGDAEALVIGGGQLLQDNDGNFPTKIADLVSVAEEMRLPYSFHGVGVGSRWTRRSRNQVAGRLRAWPPRSINVRDEASRLSLGSLLAETWHEDIAVGPDPAILAADILPARLRRHDDGASFGLNVIAPNDVANLSGGKRESVDRLRQLQIGLLRELGNVCTSRQMELVVFTNGAFGDNLFARQIVAESAVPARVEAVEDLPRLLETLARLHGAITFRLHASILLTSFAVKHCSIAWDEKVTAFARAAGFGERCFTLEDLQAGDVVEKLAHEAVALASVTRKDRSDHRAAMQKRAREEIERTLLLLGPQRTGTD